MPALMAIGITMLLVVVLLFALGKGKSRKEVMFLRPRDKRGERLDVTRETDRSVLCEKSDPVHRFIKVGSSFVFKDAGKTVIRFFGIEGSAYTALLKTDVEPVKKSIEDYLIGIWGKADFEKLPPRMREAAKDDKIGVIIEPIKVNAEELGLDILSSDDVNDESDATVLARLSKMGTVENFKSKLLGNIVWMILGMGIYAIIQQAIGAMG